MCEFPITKKRPIPLARRIAFCIPALLLPAALAAQEPRQLALLRGQIGVDPDPGSLLAAPARLVVSRLPLADALARLAERSRLQIAFSPTLLPEGHRVDCDCTALSTARALDRLLAGTDLGYVELGSQVVVVPRREPEAPGAYWDAPSGISAVATLTGVVRDSVHLEPVAFARVTVTPAGRDTVLASAISDRYGAFVVPALPASKPVRVEVRTLGHAWTRTYSALPAEPVRALLRPSPIGLEALDAVGRPGELLSSFRDGFVVDTALLQSLPAMLDTDVGRATALAPSTSAPSDFTSLPYLRGGSSHGTPVLLDGVRLFNAFHFGGFISAINPEVVKSATVLAGPGPDQLAIGSLSGAIDIATRDGSRDRPRAAGSLGLASTRFTVEGPIGTSVSYLVGARRTHPRILGLVVDEPESTYSFRDLHAKVTSDLGGVRRFSVSGHLNSESINHTQEVLESTVEWLDHTQEALGFRNRPLAHRNSLALSATALSAHYRDRLGGGAVIDANLGQSRFASDLFTRNGRDSASAFIGGSMSETRADLRVTWHAGGVAIVGGAQALRFQMDHANSPVDWYPEYPEATQWDLVWRHLGSDRRRITDFLPELALSDDRWRLAAYSSVSAPLLSGFSTRGGVRVDRFQRLATTFAPFAEVRYAGSWWSARVSGSRSYQELASLRNEEVLLASMVAYDLLLPVVEAPVPRSTELSLGWEGVQGKLRVRLDAYTRSLDDLRLPVPEPDPGAGTVLVDPSLWKMATGTARGIEATWSWIDDRGLSLLGSYRWASASRTAGSRTYTPRFHRDHEFEVVSSFRRGAQTWSVRVVLGSGQPHTPWLATVPSEGVGSGIRDVFVTDEHNSARLPYHLRIDVGWRRAIEVSWLGGGTMVPHMTLTNLLNRENVVGGEPYFNPNCRVWCRPSYPDHMAFRRQIPLFPFIGVEFRF